MLSYWEKQSFLNYDHIIVGSGIVGLSTAIELKEQYANQRVLVLERSMFPYGASTRNAGFACMGSFTELLDDLKNQSEEEVLSLFLLRRNGLQLLRNRLGDGNIDYKEHGSHELITEKALPLLQKLDYINQIIWNKTGIAPFALVNEKIAQLGFAQDQVKALISVAGEGELNTGKMMRSLTDLAISKGVEIKTGAWVSSFSEDVSTVNVQIEDACRKTVQLQGNKLYICTNAFTGQLMPEIDIAPGRGQVLLTHPIQGLPFKGIFHFDDGYYYFREFNGGILFGGGRNVDFEGETTTDISLNDHIQNDLEEKLNTLIIPGLQYEVAYRWAGIMAFGSSKRPIVQRFSPNVYGAFRMGGMGVAIGSAIAKQLVHMVAKDTVL